MKKRIVLLVLAISISTASVTEAKVIRTKAPKNTYPTMAEVSRVKRVRGKKYYKITAVDAAGRAWAWYDDNTDQWEIGDYAALTMHTNGTKSVYDDIILDARYCGYDGLF